MAEHYKKMSSANVAAEQAALENMIIVGQQHTASYAIADQEPQPLKMVLFMKLLSLAQFGSAFFIFIFGSAALGVSINMTPARGFSLEASGVWGGVLCGINTLIGLAATFSAGGNFCLQVTNFVLSIICAVICGVIIILSSIYVHLTAESQRYYYKYVLSGESYYQQYYNASYPDDLQLLKIFNSIIIFFAVVYCIV